MSLRKMSPVFALEKRHRLASRQGSALWAGPPVAPTPYFKHLDHDANSDDLSKKV
jgi:hypothetical protein